MYIKVLFSCFLYCQLLIGISQVDSENCIHKTCHDCITDPIKCAWCSTDNLELDQRCKLASEVSNDWCPGDKEDPSSEINVTDDKPFISTEGDELQIKPQRIKLKLRVGEPVEFEFHYKAAKDYPMDLYFLLDSSGSMKAIRNNIVEKSEDIYTAMTKLTNNVYLGLGSFVDKNVLPFNDLPNTTICYSFKHTLNLTDDLGEFKKALEQVEFGHNYDHPESGLDGLAQAMACKETLGWRTQSRKMIVFLSDDRFHSAGDGKLAGITNPYDGGCYLDDKGFYLKEKEMDYPSAGIISKLAADEQFTILFVVTKYEEEYKVLSSAISGALNVAYDGDKISAKLGEFYKQISDNLKLDVNMEAEDKDHFEIVFNPDCTNDNNCAVVIGEEKHITGTIILRNHYGKNHLEIPIVPRGLKENLNLDIDIITNCACEHNDRTEPKSGACSYAGDRQCGICNCNEGKTGPTCQCNENSNINSTSKTSCIKDGVECSNNGICMCDACSCYSGYDGPYCEFRTDDCKRDHTGALCSGHGVCMSGNCHCEPQWTGTTCECNTNKLSCTDTNGNICNNRGHCDCGRCRCDDLPNWDIRGYQDQYCNQWPCENCHDRQCRELTSCIACHSSNDTDCSAECGQGLAVANASTVTEDVKSNWNVCTKYNLRVMSGCYSNFSYIYNDDQRGIALYVLSEPDCVESYYIYGSMSLLTLLVIGLASLVACKLITDARDRKEFKQFLLSAREEDEEILNQCYAPPSTTFRNPMFKRSFR